MSRRRQRSAAETKDPEMVSGMLTAIQDFVRDSVSGAESENLETIRMGEIEVVLAYGPDAILAGFVRGVRAAQLSRVFQDTLDAIEQKKPKRCTFPATLRDSIAAARNLEACLGIVLTIRKARGTQFYIAGLRDPLAADPASLLTRGLASGKAEFHWEEYHSLVPALPPSAGWRS
jgi:hypothetical protein